jgi:hypothetical protein
LITVALALAALACNVTVGGEQDVPATINAVSTRVELTLAAQTGLPPVTLPTPLPTFTPISAITPTPATPASPLAPASLPAPATPIIPTPTGELTRTGGLLVRAPFHSTAPQIDGDIAEWGPLPYSINQAVFKPENWAGPADQSANFTLAWDAANLYLAAHVIDDVHAQTQTGETIFRGDSLEILLDADLAGDFGAHSLSADDFQLGLTPGAQNGGGPEAYLWFPRSKAGPPSGVTIAARPDEAGSGYFLEAAIPWSAFGLTPAASNRYGFALSSSDNDTPGAAEQQSMISTSPTRSLSDPTTWGMLVLDN